jgi:tetratricopeptide (TPR) repeat protein
MRRALDQIRQRNLSSGEFGRIMNAVNIVLFRRLYPDVHIQLPISDPPQSHTYARILRDIDRGVYSPPAASSTDYLELVLPFLALLNETRQDRLLPSLPDLRRAASLDPGSVLAPLFMGMVHERTGSLDEALADYTGAAAISEECYPARLGLARIYGRRENYDAAVQVLEDLIRSFPDNFAVKRQLALGYYQKKDWSRAQAVLTECLQQEQDGELLLMLAHSMVEQGRFLPAQRPLDQYSSINAQNPLYLFLRARVQAEGLRNQDSALNYLRSLIRAGGAENDALIYAARLFMESPRSEDRDEGRALVRRLLDQDKPPPEVIRLSVRDSINSGDWQTARNRLAPLLQENPQNQDLLSAYTIERGLGNNAAALAYARDLYEKNPADDEGAAAYISALIETGRQAEAGRLIESRLAANISDTQKSRYYYLRSRIRSADDQIVADLRASLFADPRNLSSMIAMFEFYHFRRPEKARAIIYLRQALAQDPTNAQLRRYAEEYPEVMN